MQHFVQNVQKTLCFWGSLSRNINFGTEIRACAQARQKSYYLKSGSAKQARNSITKPRDFEPVYYKTKVLWSSLPEVILPKISFSRAGAPFYYKAKVLWPRLLQSQGTLIQPTWSHTSNLKSASAKQARNYISKPMYFEPPASLLDRLGGNFDHLGCLLSTMVCQLCPTWLKPDPFLLLLGGKWWRGPTFQPCWTELTQHGWILSRHPWCSKLPLSRSKSDPGGSKYLGFVIELRACPAEADFRLDLDRFVLGSIYVIQSWSYEAIPKIILRGKTLKFVFSQCLASNLAEVARGGLFNSLHPGPWRMERWAPSSASLHRFHR